VIAVNMLLLLLLSYRGLTHSISGFVPLMANPSDVASEFAGSQLPLNGG
jgi:hypothetical protein